MNAKDLGFLIVGLAMGLIVSRFVPASWMGHGSMNNAMNSMMGGLQGKYGADFDRTFIDEMTLHHRGAVVMAQSALQYAEKQEIKDLAQRIIDAQNGEIEMMRGWRGQWFK